MNNRQPISTLLGIAAGLVVVPAVVAEDYVRHDVYITKVIATMGDDLQKHFGPDYARLREVFA